MSSVSSSPGVESNPVCSTPEFVPVACSASAGAGLQQDDGRPAPRERQGGRDAHHAATGHHDIDALGRHDGRGYRG